MTTLHKAYLHELRQSEVASAAGRFDLAFAHLERAHILGQRHLRPHWQTHWRMLAIARQRGDGREIFGQLLRLAATPLGWLLGWVPIGNTGGANVSALRPLPLPPDLAALLPPAAWHQGWALRVALLAGATLIWIGTG